jgi:hypothetical protein
VQTSRATTSSTIHVGFTNNNGQVGLISTNLTTTAYQTTSDERLKDYNADYDPAEAIAIIRADPVLSFTWKATGDEAVGWFAQRSHAVNEDLACYTPAEAGEKDEPVQPEAWGIDYGRRTPYLWAALTNVLDRLEALEAKLSITDPKPTRKKAA